MLQSTVKMMLENQIKDQKTFNLIFQLVKEKYFDKISICITVKDVCDLLERNYIGGEKIKKGMCEYSLKENLKH